MEKLQAGDPQSAGPYLLQGRLGADATGQVFLGWSPTSQPGGQQVAVKVIHPHLAAVLGFRTEFAREVAAVRQLTSPFLLPVVDADVSAPAPWLAAPLGHGMSLAASVAVHGPLPPGAVLSLAAGLAEGLRTAHAAGVVHRSVKPDDVLLTADGPRLTDLGLGEVLDRARAAAPAGSAARVFQSPEQAKGLTAGPASDVYSLGMVLLYAATGTWLSHYAAHLEQLSDELRSVIGPCLAAAPAERPATAQVRESVLAAHPTATDLAGWRPAGIQPPAGQFSVPPGQPAAQAAPPAVQPPQPGPESTLPVSWPQPPVSLSPPAGRQRETRSRVLLVSAIALAYLLLGGGAFAVVHAVQHKSQPTAAASGTESATPAAPQRTGPVTSAALTNTLNVKETVTSAAQSVQGFKAGASFTDSWLFSSDCTQSPCQVSLMASVDGQGFQATLTQSKAGSYSGTAQVNGVFTCGGTGNSDATLDILVTPTAAAIVNGQWTVSRITGSMKLLAASRCGGTVDLNLSGN